MENEFRRIGNWYIVGDYSVLIQKEKNSIFCDTSSILIFDYEFNRVTDPEVYRKMEKIMERVDWKYDMVDEEV